ncbi:hypothetical protein D8674_001365 [Pyrus ussuriensis x Pyrus communis]|uniref:Agenet domain-containing protein n=1 Tax=Pyrus ussuriensis x Pyrus communis TaxID=2448454 RepID=A0A5N5F615_9ROSA|nr:hypothetical protein D8674_001365 [Pyrus ussuriensis x Pyrus communis]
MVVKKSQSATHLVKDSKVEVCSNEDGFKGAWFPAKIIDSKPLIPATKKKRKSFSDGSSNSFSPTKAVVQYETLLSDDDPDKPLTEFVEMGQIRPVPPDDNVDRPFEPGDKVDAFHLDAWWPGVVIKREEDEYTVGFMYPPDLLVARRSELRSHWDLADGVWVRAKKEMMMVSNFSPGTAVEMNPDEERLFYAWFPAIYLGQLGIDSFLLQYKKSNNSDVKIVVRGHQIRPQPPNSTERDFSLLDKVDAFHDMGWWVGDITKVLKGNKYAVTLSCTRQEKEFSLSELRTHMDWNDGGWATMSHGRWITEVRKFAKQKVRGLDDQALTHFKRKGKKSSEIEKTGEVNVGDEHVMDNTESSGIKSESEATGGSHAEASCLLPMEGVGQNEDGVSSAVEGNGKLTALLVEGVYVKPTAFCEKHDGTGVVAQVESTWTQVAKDKGSEEAMRETETVNSTTDYLTQGQVAVTGVLPKTSAHDQPLSLCINEMHSVKTIGGTSNPAETDNQQNEVTGTQVETGVTVNIEQQESPDSPFVKSYPEIWEKVESMDVFRRYPQKPHFYPLVKYGELSRESLAIAKMLTFASLVEKTSKLNIEVPDDFFDSSFQELGDLETFGFDVKAVRDRLNSLLEMKVQLGQLQDKSKEVEIQIAEQTQERKKHNEKISGVAKQIKDLQDQLVVLMSEDAAKGTEISRLQSKENAIAESILSTRRNFEKLSEAW